MWQARQDITQIFIGVEFKFLAGFEWRIEDGAGAPGFGTAEKEPVLFADAIGKMAFSTRLLSTSTWACSV